MDRLDIQLSQEEQRTLASIDDYYAFLRADQERREVRRAAACREEHNRAMVFTQQMQRWRDTTKHYVKKYMVEFDEQEQRQCDQINTMLQSAGNPRFSSDLKYQTPIILDLGTNKSVIPTVQAFQDHTYFPKVLRLGMTHKVDIIGIGSVGGLSNVLQSADGNKPALLSASNYLEAWPNSIITLDVNQVTIYQSPYKPTDLTSSQIQQSLPAWKIIATFQQINNIYIAPN